MFQMMIKQNVLAIGRNQKACMEGCKDKNGSSLFDCQSVCVGESTQAITLLDKKISDDVVMSEDKIFGTSDKL